MLKLKLQHFDHLMRRADSFEKPWDWERLRAEGERDDRGWDGWMASLTQWTWVWVNSRRWWRTGRPGLLQFMGSQRVGHDWATELQSLEYRRCVNFINTVSQHILRRLCCFVRILCYLSFFVVNLRWKTLVACADSIYHHPTPPPPKQINNKKR